jgi:hypothetical protein
MLFNNKKNIYLKYVLFFNYKLNMSLINRYGGSIAIGMVVGQSIHYIEAKYDIYKKIKVLEDENKNILNSIDNS